MVTSGGTGLLNFEPAASHQDERATPGGPWCLDFFPLNVLVFAINVFLPIKAL